MYSSSRSDEEKLLAAENFADSLRSWYWNHGSGCNNDFVIVLAVKENKVRISLLMYYIKVNFM